MIKKTLVSAFVILFSGISLGFVLPVTANAADCTAGADTSFLSFPTWYRGLGGATNSDGTCTFSFSNQNKSVGLIIFTVALNIIDIALRIVAILAVGFVIYGGFRYVISRGEPEATKNALDTILKAVIGAAIAFVAALVVSFIVGRLSA